MTDPTPPRAWSVGTDDWQQCRYCGSYVQLRYDRQPTGRTLEHMPDCIVNELSRRQQEELEYQQEIQIAVDRLNECQQEIAALKEERQHWRDSYFSLVGDAAKLEQEIDRLRQALEEITIKANAAVQMVAAQPMLELAEIAAMAESALPAPPKEDA